MKKIKKIKATQLKKKFHLKLKMNLNVSKVMLLKEFKNKLIQLTMEIKI